MTADIPTVCSGIGASLEADGYAIARRIFDETEIADTLAYYMETAERGIAIPGHWEPDLSPGATAERRFARFDMAHELADGIRRIVFHDRLKNLLRAIMGDEPVMIWNVFYYMPPGARGFPYHQDDYWNRVGPGTGITAWIALDDVDAENGALRVVPGTQNFPIQRPQAERTGYYLTDQGLPVPQGYQPRIVPVGRGDVLFFNGRLIHASARNDSRDRWRRALVAWYMPRSSHEVAVTSRVMDFEGRVLDYPTVPRAGDGPCKP